MPQMLRHSACLAIVAVAVLAGTASVPADAAIQCREGFQITRGQQIATPYCQDEWLAQVARSYGTKVTAAAIRNSPSTKQSVCRHIGHDNRVSSACAGWIDRGPGPRF